MDDRLFLIEKHKPIYTPEVMMFHRLSIFLIAFALLYFTNSSAQDRFYNIYVDTDGSITTGCDVNLPEFSSNIGGVESRLTITTDSALPPNVTATTFHQCDGTAFGTGSAIAPAAMGLNTGMNGTDVFEVGFNQNLLNVTSSGNVIFYFTTDSNTASDIVLTQSNGGPIILGFVFPVPALGLLALCLIICCVLLMTRKSMSSKMALSVMLIGVSSLVWAMNIIVDGQTNDWTTFQPSASDPVGDTSQNGSFADLTAVFLTKVNETVFVRLDVVDVENQAPSANGNSVTTLEEQAVTITLTGSDAEGSAITFAEGNAPTNGVLSNFTVVDGTSSTVDYIPNTDFAGSDGFTVVANDGQIDSAPASIAVQVNPVNDAPSFISGGNVNVLKTAGAYNQIWATDISAGPVDESSQNLTFNITTNDNAAIFTVQPSIDSSGMLTFEGVPDATGTANLSVNLVDDGGTANGGFDTSTTVDFTITLQGVNDEPTFTAGADQSLLEDAGTQTIVGWATAISAGPPDESGQALTFNVTNNDDPALFSVTPQIDATTGDLSFTPAADANGIANISVFLMDDGGTANGGDDTSPTASFNITLTAVNDAPSFTAGANQNALEGAGAQTVNSWATGISPGPADEAAQATSFNVSNDNNGLFTVQPNIDAAGNLTYTPEGTVLGSATVTVSISDDGGTANGGVDTSTNQTFIISVTPVNDEPSFTSGPDETVSEDAGAQTVNGWATNIMAGPPDEAGQNLTFNITANNNPGLFSVGPAVSADGTLSYTPAADANGTANITIELMDDGGTANGGDDTSPPQSFSITVNPLNDAPDFTVGANQSVLEESGPQTVNGWATNISPGPSNESAQSVSFNVANNNNALFSVQPAVDTSGNLTYTPTANTSGSATVSVAAMDDGGTANGGVDTSAPQNFTITVVGINDAPSFTAAADPAASSEDGGAESLAWASGISAGPADESGQTLTFNLTQTSIDTTLSFSTVPSVNSTTGNVEYTAAANAFGTATYDVVLMDDGGVANGGIDTSSPAVSLTITVDPVNDPPSVTAPGPFAVTTNIRIEVPDGSSDLLANATDVEPSTTLSIQGSGSIATTQGGTITVNNATGEFSYDPPPGFTGTDTFDYQVCDDGVPVPAACSTAVTVTLNVSGNTIWFIDNTAAAGNGTLQTPFNSLSAFNSSANPGTGHYVFLATGTGTYSEAGITLAAGQTLLGQGRSGSFDVVTGITAAPFSINRPTLGGARPLIVSSANGINMSTNNDIRGLNIGNTTNFGLRGTVIGNLTLDEVGINGNGGGIQITTSGALSSVSFDVLDSTSSTTAAIDLNGTTGTVSIASSTTGINNNFASPAIRINGGSLNMTYPGSINNTSGRSIEVSNNTGGILNFNGLVDDDAAGILLNNNTGATINFSSLDLDTATDTAFTATGGGTVNITGSTNTIDTTTGLAINIQNTSIGTSGITLRSVSKNGGTTGIDINGAGSAGFFTITGTGTSNGSGGTIQNTTLNGILIENTNNINISNVNLNNGTNESAGCLAGVNGVSGDCNAAIEFNTVSNINLTNLTIDGNGDASDELGIYANTVTNFDMNNVTVQNVSDSINEHGIYVVNLAGIGSNTSRWQDLTVNNTAGDTAILVTQNTGNAELIVDGDTNITNALEAGFEARTTTATANLTVTLGDAPAIGSETTLIENTNIGALFIADNGNLTANVRNSIIQPGAGIGSIIRPGSGSNGVMFVGVTAQSGGTTGSVTLNAIGNSTTQEDGGAGGTGRSANALGGSQNISGNVSNNTIGSNDEFVDGFFSNFTGVGNLTTNTVLIDNNIINMTGTGTNETISGIEYNASDSAGELSMTVTNNTIFSAGDNGFSGGIISLAGDTGGGDNNILCTDLIGNDATLPNAPVGVDGDDYVFVSFSGTEIRLENPTLGVLSEAQIDAHIIGNDAGTTTATDVNVFNVGSGFHSGVSACPQ